jgi:sulfoxide reductase heme-binding subunit YedZ
VGDVHVVAATNGFVSLFLLWLAVMWGIALGRGWAMTRMKHSTLLAIHHTLALVGLTLGIVHAGAQLAVPGGPIRVVDEFIPFVNPHDPIGVGVAVLGTELMIALILSVPLQKKLGYNRWRGLHVLAYAAYTLISGHVVISGSEVSWPVAGLVFVGWLMTIGAWLGASDTMRRKARVISDAAGDRMRGRQAAVQVDPVKCARFGFCEQEAPDVFQLRSDGQLTYRNSVPEEELGNVLNAVRVCPARAISMTRATSRLVVPPPRTEDKEPAAAVNGSRSNVTGLHRNGGN